MAEDANALRDAFLAECDDLLASFFDAHRSYAEGGGAAAIDEAFRAVHSMKGGAAAFGLDDLVTLAHALETALDETRAGRLVPGGDDLDLLARCADMLSDLVAQARRGATAAPAECGSLLTELARLSGAGAPQADGGDPAPIFAAVPVDLGAIDAGGPAAEAPPAPRPDDGGPRKAGGAAGSSVPMSSTGLRIRFRPDPELYESGNEPLFLLRQLADLGPCRTTLEFTPAEGSDIAAIGAGLSWIVELETDVPAEGVLEIFEFVAGLCDLSVEPAAGPGRESPGKTEGSPAAEGSGGGGVAAGTDTTALRHGRQDRDPAASVRVPLPRIDRLLDLVGELVIAQSMLSRTLAEAGLPANSEAMAGADGLSQLVGELRDSVMSIRAQPVRSLFRRMSRIVRETAHAAGKKARFIARGEDTEVDMTVIEQLADPLMHMVRNAVDHGLESPAERAMQGKDAEGLVTLSAGHRSDTLLIELTDDGRGFDQHAIRRRAIERGLIGPDAELTEGETLALAFQPGLSTAGKLSNLSGRGVGMDVVGTRISALGGRISVTSEAGRGTRIAISLPLTLAVLEGLAVGVATEVLVVPLGAVLETFALSQRMVREIGPGAWVVLLRGEVPVPLLDLGATFGFRAPGGNVGGRIGLLVGEAGGPRVVLAVDRVEDQLQVVVKGLQTVCGRVPGVAAATILSTGRVALIVDVAAIVARTAGPATSLPDFRTAV